MHDLENAITDRRSIRLFLRDKPVPQELVMESLELAIRAPSNSNIQPWHVVFASGPARDRLAEALLEQADIAAPNVPALPESFAASAPGTGRPGLRHDGDRAPRCGSQTPCGTA